MEKTFDVTIVRSVIEWLKNENELKESVYKSLWNSKTSNLHGNAGVKVNQFT